MKTHTNNSPYPECFVKVVTYGYANKGNKKRPSVKNKL